MLRPIATGALLVLLFPASAHAGDRSPRVVVRFAPSVSKVEAARLVSAVRAQVGDAAATTLEADMISSDWIVDVDRSEGGLLLHMTESGAREARATRLVAHDGELGASEAASIVRAFVLATTEQTPNRETNANAVDEAEAPVATSTVERMAMSPLPSRSPSSERDRGVVTAGPVLWRARLAALYTGATYAAGLPWQSGARLEGAYAFHRSFYGGLTYAVHPTAEIATETASVRSSRQSGAVFAGIENEHHGWAVGADASVGLERTTRSSVPSALLTGTATRLAPTFAVRLHGRWRVPGGRGTALDLAPALEIVPGRDRFVLDAAGSTTELVVASARFRVDVGGTFDLF